MSERVRRANQLSCSKLESLLNLPAQSNIRLRLPSDLKDEERKRIWGFVEQNSKLTCGMSSLGWEGEKRRRNLFSRQTRLLLIFDNSPNPNIIGFSSFRFEFELSDDKSEAEEDGDGLDTLYLYEMQISSHLQCRDYYPQLINRLDKLATGTGMQKTLITVLKNNDQIPRLFTEMGFVKDIHSPDEEDHVILSKPHQRVVEQNTPSKRRRRKRRTDHLSVRDSENERETTNPAKKRRKSIEHSNTPSQSESQCTASQPPGANDASSSSTSQSEITLIEDNNNPEHIYVSSRSPSPDILEITSPSALMLQSGDLGQTSTPNSQLRLGNRDRRRNLDIIPSNEHELTKVRMESELRRLQETMRQKELENLQLQTQLITAQTEDLTAKNTALRESIETMKAQRLKVK